MIMRVGVGTDPAPGWYPDPHGRPELRWWDGREWTDNLSQAPSSQRVPPPRTIKTAAVLTGIAFLMQPVAIFIRFAVPAQQVVVGSWVLLIAAPVLALVAFGIALRQWLFDRKRPTDDQSASSSLSVLILAGLVAVLTLIEIPVYPLIFPS
jgi:hypothetical protein